MTLDKIKEYNIIKQIVGNNISAINILLSITDKNRFDIIEWIRYINRKDESNRIDSEMIIALYNKCDNDVGKLIKLIDKQLKAAKSMRSMYDY